MTIGEVDQRTVFHYGIEFEGLHYNNDALQQIRRRTEDPPKVAFKYFEEDVRFIQVWDALEKSYVRVEVRPRHAEYVKDLNRDTHRAIRAHQIRCQRESKKELDLMQAKREIYDLVDALKKDKKMRLRKLGQVMTNINSDQLLSQPQAVDQALKKRPRLAIKPPAELDAGLEDHLPMFEIS
jgi:putative transposase